MGQWKNSAISGSIQKRATPIRIPPEKGTKARPREWNDVSHTPPAALRIATRNMANGIGLDTTCSEYTSYLF
jgi:hypothetical protein